MKPLATKCAFLPPLCREYNSILTQHWLAPSANCPRRYFVAKYKEPMVQHPNFRLWSPLFLLLPSVLSLLNCSVVQEASLLVEMFILFIVGSTLTMVEGVQAFYHFERSKHRLDTDPSSSTVVTCNSSY